MAYQPYRREHEGILRIGLLPGLYLFDGDEAGLSVWRCKLPRVEPLLRQENPLRVPQLLNGSLLQGREEPEVFSRYLLDGAVVEAWQSKGPSEHRQYLPVGPGITHRLAYLVAPLDSSLTVHVRAFLLAESTGRKDVVGVLCSPRHEDVLDDEEVELSEGVPHAGEICLANRWVLTDDVERPNLALLYSVPQLREVKAPLRRQIFDPPERGHPLPELLIGQGHVTWEKLAEGAHVSGSLHVVLAAHGIETAALTDVAEEQCEVYHSEDVFNPRNVLGKAHSPHYGPTASQGECPRHLSDQPRGDPGNFLRVLGGVLPHGHFDLGEARRPGPDKLIIVELLSDYNVHHGVGKGYVRSRPYYKAVVGEGHRPGLPHVNDDDSRPFPFRPQNVVHDHRVGLRWIVAPD